MSNPRSFTLKKWFMELLKEEYMQHDEVIERVATALVTEKDIERFGKMIMNVYERAYKKAVEDYRTQIEKAGLKVTLGTEELS